MLFTCGLAKKIVFLGTIILHLAVGGLYATKRLVWYVHYRNAGVENLEQWHIKRVKYYDLAQKVKELTPDTEELYVIDRQIGLVLSFYAFPRKFILTDRIDEQGMLAVVPGAVWTSKKGD